MQYVPWILLSVSLLIGAIIVQKLTDSIAALNAAIAALQTRVTGSVPVAAVEAASVQIDAAVQALNGIGV